MPRLRKMHAKAVKAIHPFSEKKMMNMKMIVVRAFTISGMVWAMKCSIFSTFCSIIFFTYPTDVEFRYPSDNCPRCSERLIFNPYKIRKAAIWEDIRLAYRNRIPMTRPAKASQPQRTMKTEPIADRSEAWISNSFNIS